MNGNGQRTNGGGRRGLVANVAAVAASLQKLGRNERLRRYALLVAAAGFIAGLVLSVRQMPDDLRLAHPGYLLLIAAVGVPLVVVANTFEAKISAALVGTRFGWIQSLRIALVASAANMLPLPGGPVVRVAALKVAGAPLLRSSFATALIATIWLGLAFLVAGASLIERQSGLGLGFLAIGAGVALFSALALFRLKSSWQLLSLVVILKSASIAVGIVRMQWALAAFGLDVSFARVAIFAISGVAGSAVSIVPAGLGVYEGVSALLAPLSEIPAAIAFLAASLNRIVAIAVMLPMTLLASMAGTARPGGQNEPR